MAEKERRRKRGCFGCFVDIFILIIILAAAYIGIGYAKGYFKEMIPANTTPRDFKVFESVPFEEISIEEGELADKYYYSRLTKDEKIIYKEILQGVRNCKEEIYVHSNIPETVNWVYGRVLYDCPELFWCSGNAETFAKGSYCVLKCEYLYTGDEKTSREQQIENAAAVCLQGMDAGFSEYEKIKYIYEYIIHTTDYNEEASDNQNIYSVLVNRQSVCAGYARATQYLLERAGIYVTLMTGTVESGAKGTQNHAWNLVRCDGEYYYVDATWGDPVFSSEREMPDGMIDIYYDYLCCNDAELFRTHTLDEDIDMPPCTSDKYNYYKMNGRYYEVYINEEILAAMKQDIQNKTEKSVFKFASSEVYKEAVNGIEDNAVREAAQFLAGRYGLSQVHYYYMASENLNKITVYWMYE